MFVYLGINDVYIVKYAQLMVTLGHFNDQFSICIKFDCFLSLSRTAF